MEATAPKYDPCVNPLVITRTVTNKLTKSKEVTQFEKRCGTRRADLCNPCSVVWKDDAYFALMKPAKEYKGTITFITLTAPGWRTFGKAHTASYHQLAKERCACSEYHGPNDPLVGIPLSRDKFEHKRVVEFNNNVSRLVAVTLQKIYRLMATEMSKSVDEVRLPTARVVEWQERGLLHVHIIVRGSIPTFIVENAVNGSAKTNKRRRIEPASTKGHRWGQQVNVRHINSGDETQIGILSGYMTKVVSYALKDVGTSEKEITPARQAFIYKLRSNTNAVIQCDKTWAECSASSTAPSHFVFRNLELPQRHFCVKHRRGHHQIGFTGNVLTLNRRWGSSLKEARIARSKFASEKAQSLRPAVKAGRLDTEKNSITHVVERKSQIIWKDLLVSRRKALTVIRERDFPPITQEKEQDKWKCQLTLLN